MSTINDVLKHFGLSVKQSSVYLKLLAIGPSSVRKIADEVQINRGTTHAILKELHHLGLVSYYHQETRQYFVAEHPKALNEILKKRQADMQSLKQELAEIMPQLNILHATNDQPVMKYYEGNSGIRTILQDVLDITQELPKKTYAVYSSANIRKYLYAAFPNFTAERERRGIAVQVIALGSGGKETKFAERRWLKQQKGAPTYQLIYANKIALISIDATDTPRGIIMEDAATAHTQRLLFDHLWQTLQ
jgi:sugar-specific transcriptional regulator TrmB